MSPRGLERTSCRHCITGPIPPCPVHSLLFAGTHVCKQLQSLRLYPYSELQCLWHPMHSPWSPSPAPQSPLRHRPQGCHPSRSLVDAIFSAGQASHDRCILTPKNETTDTINAVILESLPADLHVYESADYFGEDSESQSNIYPNEFLNTLLPSGMPQHRLNLKVGAPIILIRNLNRAAGLMNGTRLSVTSCLRYTIQATVLTGTHKGNSVRIPRINLAVSDDDDLPIKFIRRQFPVKLAFCMTINKSQGQTFSKVGLLLATRPFSHG